LLVSEFDPAAFPESLTTFRYSRILVRLIRDSAGVRTPQAMELSAEHTVLPGMLTRQLTRQIEARR
jgi:hypothetical protein